MAFVVTQAHQDGEPMAPPKPERQIHRACGDVRAALFDALETLSETTVPCAARDDVFRAFSNLGHIQYQIALALHATNLLDQMVGTPAEHRRPWSYYRARIGKKLSADPSAPSSFDGLRVDEVDAGHVAGRIRARRNLITASQGGYSARGESDRL